MVKECESCKELFLAPRKTSKYCTVECQHLSLNKTVSRTCQRSGCEGVFRTTPSDPKVYCCRGCAAQVNNKVAPKRKVKGSCVDCTKPIRSSLKRCDACRAEWENRPPTPKPSKDKTNAYMRDRYARVYPVMRERALLALGWRCITCGATERLEFDHIAPDSKTIEVTDLLDTHSWESIKKEIEKCQLLCKRCHVEKTREDYRSGAIKNRMVQ